MSEREAHWSRRRPVTPASTRRAPRQRLHLADLQREPISTDVQEGGSAPSGRRAAAPVPHRARGAPVEPLVALAQALDQVERLLAGAPCGSEDAHRGVDPVRHVDEGDIALLNAGRSTSLRRSARSPTPRTSRGSCPSNSTDDSGLGSSMSSKSSAVLMQPPLRVGIAARPDRLAADQGAQVVIGRAVEHAGAPPSARPSTTRRRGLDGHVQPPRGTRRRPGRPMRGARPTHRAESTS